jgi:hypothetical protein
LGGQFGLSPIAYVLGFHDELVAPEREVSRPDIPVFLTSGYSDAAKLKLIE